MKNKLISVKNSKLPSYFYQCDTVTVARNLLGKIIFRKIGSTVLSGIIVETEAYTGHNDPASHSFRGRTKRNEVMFEGGGKAYVYFTYGNHYCFNVVTGEENVGCAVLLRAVEPLTGIPVMMKNRGTHNIYNLTNGPGKFTRAFAIDKNLNGADLRGNVIYITVPNAFPKFKIIRSKRIGITRNTDKLYRFYIANNPFVSRMPKSLINRHPYFSSINGNKNHRDKSGYLSSTNLYFSKRKIKNEV